VTVSLSFISISLNEIIVHFGRNPRNGSSPPKDNSDVNIMNLIGGVSLVLWFG
jgi:hypothetical protein